VVEVPKLDVMSCRTTPDASRTLGPLEPSPGYGPAVSCGISTPHSAMARVNVGDADGVADAEAAGVAVVVAELLAEADAVLLAGEVDPPGVHAARVAAAVPAPKNSPRERRLIRVERSNSRPRSWLGWGSWGGCGEVVMDP
jgi:hypothetical protein